MTLSYDPAGRLFQTVASSTTTRFLYDGVLAIGEYNASNALVRRYVFGPSIDEPIVWYEGSGTTDRRWLVADELGSVTAVRSGAGVTYNTYGEYGQPQAWTGSRFRFTGQMILPEAQLYHYRARAYDPQLGRFLQTDPILLSGGMNLYAYVGNDPINLLDPFGLQKILPGVDVTVSGGGRIFWGQNIMDGGGIHVPDISPDVLGSTVGFDKNGIVVTGFRRGRGSQNFLAEVVPMCPVASIEVSLGAQLAAILGYRGFLGASAHTDLGSVRSTIDLVAASQGRWSDFITSDYTMSIGWTVSGGVPGTHMSGSYTRTSGVASNLGTMDIVDTSLTGNDGFVGLEAGGAVIFGINGRLGYQKTQGYPCPGE